MGWLEGGGKLEIHARWGCGAVERFVSRTWCGELFFFGSAERGYSDR
jgi:hypothetical protein